MATPSQWIAGARPRTLPAAVVPVAIGTGVAIGYGGGVWWRALLALFVALALQVGVNYANDYSDGVRGTDEEPGRPDAPGRLGRRAAPPGPRRGPGLLPGRRGGRDWCSSWSPGPGGCCWSARRRSSRPGSTPAAQGRTATARSARSRCSCSSAWCAVTGTTYVQLEYLPGARGGGGRPGGPAGLRDARGQQPARHRDRRPGGQAHHGRGARRSPHPRPLHPLPGPAPADRARTGARGSRSRHWRCSPPRSPSPR